MTMDLEKMSKDMDAALAEIANAARDEALEEAAKLCDAAAPTWHEVTGNPCERLARVIRSLKAPTP